MSSKVLFVDDESNILETFKAILRKRYDVTTALGPGQGLKSILTSGPFAVVVSDLNMPKMDGITFLTKVRELAPETVRIMLTGFADVEVAIRAVNEGSVFRFLTKPCSSDTLSKALDAGIAQYRLETTEKDILQRTLRGSVHVLMDALSLANPGAYGRTQRVRTLVHRLAKTMGIKLSWELDLAAMLSHIGCMSLPRKITEDISAGRELSPEELRLYNCHPAVGAGMIEQIPRLESVAAIVAEENKDFHMLQPQGARFLKIALDYDLLANKGLAPYDVYHTLLKCENCYDPSLLDALEKSIAEEGGYARKLVTIGELEVGMILEENIVTRQGLLLLAKSVELDESMIQRLHSASETFIIIEPVAILMPSSRAIVNLNDIISSMWALFRRQMVERNIDFSYEIDPSLPSGIIGEESRIKQILFNLISNAVKFTSAGRVSVSITPLFTEILRSSFNLLFIVSDSGVGIPEEKLDTIFELPVKKVKDSLARKPQRLGLGLPIVKRLVRLLDGALCVDSTVDIGTDIYFTAEVYVQEAVA